MEGGEGAGKSTQIRYLADRLRAAGRDVLVTREPGGSPGAERIRGLLVNVGDHQWRPLTEAFLHVAARSEHVATTITPALVAGRWVLCDRFIDSTMAYQGIGMGVGRDVVDILNGLVLGEQRPDLTVILDLPIEVGLARAEARGGPDRYERMGLAFHRALRKGFLEIAEREPDRCVVIDADATEADIADRVWAVVSARLIGDDDG